MTGGTGPGDDILSDGIEETINSLATAATRKMYTSCIGRVVSYDPSAGKVSVQPIVRVTTSGGTPQRLPVITNVPVQFPSGGNYSMTWPLKAGDSVLLVFSDRSMDEWLNSANAPDVTARSVRRFSVTDAICIPGVRPFGKPLKLGDATDLVIGQDEYDGPISNPGLTADPLQFRIGPTGLRIGDGGSINDLLNILSDAIVVIRTAADTGGDTMNPASQGLLTAIELRLDAIRRP